MELTKEQKGIAYFEKSGPIIVRGTAGSGKTIVGLHRVPFLKDRFCRKDDDKILVLTYTKTLINYLNHLTSKLQLDGAQKSLLSTHLSNIDVDVINIDKIMNKHSKKYLRNFWYDFPKNCDIDNAMSDAINFVKREYGNEKIIDHKNIEFLKEELEWIRSCEISSLDEYQFFERKGRGSIKKIGKNTITREAVYKLIKPYRKKMKEGNFMDINDMRICAMKYKPMNEVDKYTHIIIDEAQDLSKIQLSFIMKLLKTDRDYTTLAFLYDSSQSIYLNSWLGQGRTFKSIGLNASGRVKKLSKSFRTTKEIHLAAHNMLVKDSSIKMEEGFISPEFANSNGIKPFYSSSETFEEQISNIAEIIEGLKKKYGYRDRDIMIASKNRNSIVKISDKLNEKKIRNEIIRPTQEYDFVKDQISLTTMHSIKGLESKVVILLDVNEGVIPGNSDKELEEIQKERKLLYVGMTRASEILYICSWGKKSIFLEDIDKTLISEVSDNFNSFEGKLWEEIKTSKKNLINEDRFNELMTKVLEIEKKEKNLYQENQKLKSQENTLLSENESYLTLSN